MLAANQFAGSVLLVGPHDSSMITAVRELGKKLGLALLPTLSTPFDNNHLRDSITTFLPIEAPKPPDDAAEALRAGRLELWYQPKVNAKKLTLQGAEALVRMRHPNWGWSNPTISFLIVVILIFRSCRNSLLTKRSQIGPIFSPNYGSIDISLIFRSHFCATLPRLHICISSYPIIQLLQGF
jgi:EAL domain